MVRSRHVAAGLFFVILIIFGASSLFGSNSFYRHLTTTQHNTMTITHTVLFQFSKDVKPEDVKAACARFLALKNSCVHPTTQSSYILSLKGGQDNSPEEAQNGLTHGFVVEFASVEDRDYYVKTDPVHQAFSKSVRALVEKIVVVDFTDGEY